MAWLFGMAIECGRARDRAQDVAAHFSGLAVPLTSNRRSTFTIDVERDPLEDGSPEWWVHVVSDDLRSGEGSPELDRQLHQLRLGLYERLRSAPPYRFALVGVEVLAAITYEVLRGLLDDPSSLSPSYDGLVVAEDELVGKRTASLFAPFSTGYRWIEYPAEHR